jgi:lysophospholipase L1-like esterase
VSVRESPQRRLISRRAAALLFGSCVLAPSRMLAAMPDRLTGDVVARSQLSTGDLGRLAKVFAKARRGEPIKIGVIGGSITAGATASSPATNYSGLLLAWWRKRFPKCEIDLINAGIGGTGSMYGALRAERDLLSGVPDLVVIEFAVNDNWTDGEAYEGLVRQVLAQPDQPAVILLFMMWERGGNDQEMQAKVGVHYHLPMVSFRDAMWPEMAAGRMKWSDYIVDTVHPNDAGHAAAARFLTAMCETAMNAATIRTFNVDASLPPPLHSLAFQQVGWRDAADLVPVENEGWRQSVDDNNKPIWVGAERGERISFDWWGTGLVAVLARAPGDLNRLGVGIDGAPFQTLDASIQPRRGIIILAKDLAPGRHTVELVALDDGGKAGTAGDGVRLVGLGSIGLGSTGLGSTGPGNIGQGAGDSDFRRKREM